MGNTNSSSKDVVLEHLETIAKCFHEESLREDKETGELSGLTESSEDTIAFSLQQLDIIIKKTDALHTLRLILQNDAKYMKNKTGDHYLDVF